MMSPRLPVMFRRQPFVPPTTTAARSPATKLPFFSDLSGDRWQSIKYIISNVSFYLAALSLRERCLVQQKILLPSSPQGGLQLFICWSNGRWKQTRPFAPGDAPWPCLEGGVWAVTHSRLRGWGGDGGGVKSTARCQQGGTQ